MKKIAAYIVTALTLVSLCMCFTACSTTSYVGKYQFEFMFLSVNDTSLNYESGKAYGDATLNGESFVLYINEDNTWAMDCALPELEALENAQGVWKDGFGKIILQGNASDSTDASSSAKISANAEDSNGTYASTSVEAPASSETSASVDTSVSTETSASASSSEEAPKEKQLIEYDITATLNNGMLVVDFKDGGNWVRFSLKKVEDISYIGTYNFKAVSHSSNTLLDKKMAEDTVFVVQNDGRWYFDSSRDRVFGNWMLKNGKLYLEIRKSTNALEQEKFELTFEYSENKYYAEFTDTKLGEAVAEYEFTKAE